jgi:hypothetical protein
MARTSPTEVKKIIETDMGDTDIQSYIDSATAFLDATPIASSLGSTLLEQIEKWITAHLMASTREQMVKTGKGGPSSATFYGYGEGKGLEHTPYGQQAVSLDPTGVLKRISEGKSKLLFEAL